MHNFPKNHRELQKIASKVLKKAPKPKYKMDVFIEGRGKPYFTLSADKVSKLKNSKKTLCHTYPDRIFTYGEIEPLKKK